MVGITVGQAAGIIAALIVAVQLLAPLVIAFLLAGYLRDSESASTWSLAAGKLQSSLWPSLLRNDTSETSASFKYAKDTSPFLSGTSPRGLFSLSRKCWYGEQFRGAPGACPYTGGEVDVSGDDEGFNLSNNGLTSDIPNIIWEIFGSGTAGKPTTVSDFFDIEWRQYTSTVDEDYNGGKPFGGGQYCQLESLILEDKYVLVEGLIVDAKVGGLGFRNHTVPAVTRGATWQEDILFVEPEAVCIRNNLTIDFAIRHNYTAGNSLIPDLRLVDQGGFANINTTLPDYDEENPQANP